MIRAAITPGTQPHRVKSKTIKKDPQPFPITERGGKIIARRTRRKLMDLKEQFVHAYRTPNRRKCYTKTQKTP
jgi:hypothetical protein